MCKINALKCFSVNKGRVIRVIIAVTVDFLRLLLQEAEPANPLSNKIFMVCIKLAGPVKNININRNSMRKPVVSSSIQSRYLHKIKAIYIGWPT